MDQYFWAKLSDRLSQILGIEKFKYLDGDGFVDFFSRERSDKKKVVIVWDEFDVYGHQDQDIYKALLSSMRALKDKIQLYPAFGVFFFVFLNFIFCKRIMINCYN